MRTKRSARSKLKGKGLLAFEELQRLLQNLPAGQLRLLDIRIDAFVTRIPEVVVELLDEASPISVAEATERSRATGKAWQDTKATLELQVRLVRARALWEAGKTKDAALELVQISASASSRRAELILEAASRMRADWSAPFSLALLRSASGAFTNSSSAALSLVDAMTGAGEQSAAAMVLGQVIAGWPTLDRATVTERIGRLDEPLRAPLHAQLGE